jgi:Uma2 family endonuclease
MGPARTPATYADLQAVPDDQLAQIINGELVVMPRPAFGHAGVTSTLGMDLGGPFQRGRGGPGGWWLFDEPELHLGDDILVPDLAGWRTSRMPTRPASNTAFLTLPPDWVCEVLSPTTASIDRVAKSRIYARQQLQWSWLIDPLARTLEAYALEGGRWVQLGAWSDRDTPRVAPFDAVELQLEALWSPGEP